MSNKKQSVSVQQLIADNDYEVIQQADNTRTVRLYSSECNRPGLQLCGFYTKFVADRIQVIGGAEWCYLKGLDPKVRDLRLKTFFEHKITVLIITKNQEVFPEMLTYARENNCTILRTADSTSSDLIVSGHKLIADDSVLIRMLDNRLIGTSPKITRHFMEIRGIGIIDVERLFGIGCIMEEKEVELIIELTQWDDFVDYNRLGMEDDKIEILGKSVPKIEIPMRTGRNTSMIIEIATRNFKQKEMGYNAAEALNQRVLDSIEKNKLNH